MMSINSGGNPTTNAHFEVGGPRRKFDSGLSFPSLDPEVKNQET